jgi:hypothetical protein
MTIMFNLTVLPEETTIEAIDKMTLDWTMKAARGECAWICSDCCGHFPEGMPDVSIRP